MRIREKTKVECNQEIINAYLEEHGGGEIDMKTVATWALRKELWVVPQTDAIRQCAKELAEAARQEIFTDEKGRIVRRKHVIRIKEGEKQRYLWADIGDASPEHMKLALSQRRQGILGDCKQLKNDLDHYNDNHSQSRQLTLNFDFREDLEELDQPTEYPDAPPEDDD